MTIFGWDASHYDGALDDATLAQAHDEGIEFFTHKLGEGMSNVDTTAAQALQAARNAGIRVIGGYHFIHSGDMVAQAVRCIALADQYAPWWRTFDGWCWQTDAETDVNGHLPAPSEVKLFSNVLKQKTGKTVLVYASHGQYGDRLVGLGHPLWNANYPTRRTGGFEYLYHAYAGDEYEGWNSYSGQTPAICQYTSSATIGGKTTCDANAFRGTVEQLLALINPGGSTVTAPTPQQNAEEAFLGLRDHNNRGYTGKDNVTAGTDLGSGADAARAALAQSQANGGGISEIKALLQATPPGSVAISDADVERIAQRTADIVAQRMQA